MRLIAAEVELIEGELEVHASERVQHASPDQRLVPSTQSRKGLLGGRYPENLTPLEKRLLESLRFESGKAISCDDLIEQIWGLHGGDRDMLRQLVRRLRSKIEPDPAHPRFLLTIPGTGYCLKESRPAI